MGFPCTRSRSRSWRARASAVSAWAIASAIAGGYSDAGLPPAIHNMGLILAPLEGLAFVLLAALAVHRDSAGQTS